MSVNLFAVPSPADDVLALGHLRHAHLVDRLDQGELSRCLEGLCEVTDERLLLGVRWRWSRELHGEIEICAPRYMLDYCL